MEIKYFRLIKTIAEEGSIANSSGKLFLTQSALSHQLKDVETQLGFKVFKRIRNKWELTEEGQELYKLACSIMEKMEQGFNAIEQIRTGSKGNIKVSTECYSFYQDLPALIQQMGLLYPDIKVDLVLEATHQPISKVLAKEIDIAIVTTKPIDPSLVSIPVFEDEIFALMHQENPFNDLPFLDSNHFMDVHLIIHSFPLETVSVYEQYLKPNQIIPAKISAIPLTEVALAMVQANMGVMCMPKWNLKPFEVSEEIQFKPIGKHGLKRTHYLVVRQSDRGKKYINDFLVNFEERFQGE